MGGKHEGGKKHEYEDFEPKKDQSHDGNAEGGGSREKPAGGGKK